MSGDVQPRKRKDKKKKKDELAAEELRGTAAAFGEGDVLMHSQHEHGTGGHWCAKVIFFSLLAVLIGLIGLIILENRGLTELEANSVETQYTGILDGWIEDAPDDHHDEHTLELKHPDEEEHDEAEASDDGEQEVELEDIEHEPEDEATPVQSDELEDGDASPERTDDDEGDDAEQSDEEPAYAGTDDDNNDDDEEDFLQHDDDDDNDNNSEVDNDDEDIGDNDDREEEEHDNVSAAVSAEAPYEEVEESAEQLPADSLLEEEEYSRQQERQRQEEAAASHLWLKLSVGAALLLATHAVVRRATRAEDSAEGETPEVDGDPPPVPDRRMTLLPDELLHAEVKKSVAFEAPKPKPVVREPSPLPPQRFAPVTRAAPAAPVTPLEPEDSEPEEPEEEAEEEVVAQKPALESRATPDLELYSEDDEEDPLPTRGPKPEAPTEAEPAEESDDEVADDVEIIEDEQLDDEDPEEELGEEEEISDVDDGELLSRLEAKYGRLPEPERYERPPLSKLAFCV